MSKTRWHGKDVRNRYRTPGLGGDIRPAYNIEGLNRDGGSEIRGVTTPRPFDPVLGQDEFKIGAEILMLKDLASVLEVAPTVLLTDSGLRGESMLIVHSLRHARGVIHTSYIGPTPCTL